MSVWLASNCFTSMEPQDLSSVVFQRSISLKALLIPDLPVNTWQGCSGAGRQPLSRSGLQSLALLLWMDLSHGAYEQAAPESQSAEVNPGFCCSGAERLRCAHSELGFFFPTSATFSDVQRAGQHVTSPQLGWNSCTVLNVPLLTRLSPACDLSGPDPWFIYLVVIDLLVDSLCFYLAILSAQPGILWGLTSLWSWHHLV